MDHPRLLTVAAAALTLVDLDEANDLLTRWGHNLGPVNRPFGSQSWVFEINSSPVSVAVGASTVSATVAGYRRGEVVELARLCTAPAHRWATRVMLRTWREVGAPNWPYWPVSAVVAYSQNDRHDGRIYRFDGWTKVTDRAGNNAGPNSTWTKKRATDHPAEGPKTLWLWRYPDAPRAGVRP